MKTVAVAAFVVSAEHVELDGSGVSADSVESVWVFGCDLEATELVVAYVTGHSPVPLAGCSAEPKIGSVAQGMHFGFGVVAHVVEDVTAAVAAAVEVGSGIESADCGASGVAEFVGSGIAVAEGNVALEIAAAAADHTVRPEIVGSSVPAEFRAAILPAVADSEAAAGNVAPFAADHPHIAHRHVFAAFVDTPGHFVAPMQEAKGSSCCHCPPF